MRLVFIADPWMQRFIAIVGFAAVIGSIFLVFLVFWSTPARAAANCLPRALVVERLAKKYDETPRAVGVVSGGIIVEVFSSKRGSWTILATTVGGQSCVVASGIGWQFTNQNIDTES